MGSHSSITPRIAGLKSDAALQALIANYSVDSAYQVAQVYVAHGETDLALAWLE